MSCSHRNTLLISLVLGLFLTSFWFFQNSKFINNQEINALLYLNGSSQGFNSLRAYAVYYPLLFLLFISFRLRNPNASLIVLYETRNNYFIKRSLNTFVSSVLFSIMVTAINCIMITVYIKATVLDNYDFYYVSLLNGISVLFFYYGIGLLQTVLDDKLNSSSIANLITFILIAASYFFVDFFPWSPIMDMRVYEGMLSSNWNFVDVLMIYFRQIALIAAMLLLGQVFIKEKDFIPNEK